MTMRLNGWQRLWVILSVLYLLPVVGLTILFWPTPETTWHRAEFIGQMPADLQGKVEGAYASEFEREEMRRKLERDFPPLPPGVTPANPPSKHPLTGLDTLERDYSQTLSPAVTVSFPNRAVLDIRVAKEGDTKPDKLVAAAYWAVVVAAARAERWQRTWQMALLWFIPCLVLYALGWATAWVRRGFEIRRDG
jgi:hypothetical protein